MCYDSGLRGAVMRSIFYRLYRFDGSSSVVSADWVEAANDAEALLAAKADQGGVTREVWNRDRLVGRIGPEPFAASRC